MKDKYPEWVCHDCATEAGDRKKGTHLATYHIGICDICNVEKSVTEPRDYGYPIFKK